ncbi:MAG: OadG family transporter subunit [Hespellia sp.]|nr:OadG family transporter subunit [Hespellia sp.]
MKKRISLVLLVFVLALSFAGCSSSKSDTIEYDAATLENYSEMMMQSFAQMGDADFEYFHDLSDFNLSYTLMNAGLPVSNEDFLTMADAWQKSVADYGSYIEHGEYKVEATDKAVTLTTETTFENKTVDMEIVFDDQLQMTSMATNDHLSIGQILEKAGLNTLLGMGTVFAVLIFISLLISLFKFIPALEAKLTGKGKTVTEPKAAPKAAQTPVVTGNVSAANDAQLVAVITAAIAASEGNGSSDGFIVRSIKRRKTNKWN